MTDERSAIADEDLHAYVDDELDQHRRTQMAALLQEDAAAAAQVECHQAVNRGLHELFDPVLDEPVPERLRQAARPSRSLPRRLTALAASLLLGTAIGWMARQEVMPLPEPAEEAFVHNAFTAHAVYSPEIRHPVEVDASNEKHLTNWLSKRLQAPLRIPSLEGVGYRLLGGRLLASDGLPAALFMYQDDSGARLTLFVRRSRPDETDSAFRYARHDDILGLSWVDGPLRYALIGDLDRERISRAAKLVYAAVNE